MTPADLVFLDLETTALPPEGEVLEVAVVDGNGLVLIDTLVRPDRAGTWHTTHIHGITPEMIFQGNYPTLEQLADELTRLVKGKTVVIYNADFERKFISSILESAVSVECCMKLFAWYYGDWSDYHNSYKYKSLDFASRYVRYEWQGKQHSALADTLACRAVYQYLTDETERQRVEAIKENERLDHLVREYFKDLDRRQRQEAGMANAAWEKAFFKLAAIRRESFDLRARSAAETLCVADTGHELEVWQQHHRVLSICPPLPRFKSKKKIPCHLKFADGNCLLREVTPSALYLHRNGHISYLYDFSLLREGIDYVPVVREWPDGCYSATALKKRFRLSDVQIGELEKAAFVGTAFGGYWVYSYTLESSAIKEANFSGDR